MKSFILFVLFIGIILFGTHGIILAQENMKVVSKQVEVSKQEVTTFTYACLPHQGDYEDHEMVIANFIGAFNDQGLTPLGPLFGVYYNNPQDTKPEDLVWEIGFPVTDTTKANKPIVIKKWEYTHVAKALHIGPYEKTAEIYPEIFKWIGESKLMPAGPVMERFLSDPNKVKPDELNTEIWVPVKELVSKEKEQ